MRLKQLTDQDREELANYVARRHSMSEARKLFYENHPEIDKENRIGYSTFAAYFKSPQGVAEVQQAREAIREEAASAPLTHRGERIDILVESLDSLLGRIRSPTVDDRGLVLLSGEIRQVIKEIREEASVYDESLKGKKSPVDEFFRKLQALDPETRELIEAATEGDPN